MIVPDEGTLGDGVVSSLLDYLPTKKYLLEASGAVGTT